MPDNAIAPISDPGRRALSPREFFVAARRQPLFFTYLGTYLEACALVVGYDQGVGRGSIVDGFQQWLVNRTGGASNAVFPDQILGSLAGELGSDDPSTLSQEQHARAVETLFTWLLEYLDEVEKGSGKQ